MSSAAAQRSMAIDVLRAIAIFLVLGRHAQPMPDGPGFQHVVHEVTRVWYRGGWVGVDLFFVLSGFLVSGLLFREYQRYGTVSCSAFLIRRGLKIYPAFWVLLATTSVVFLAQDTFVARKFWVEFFFLQNYFRPFWPHLWSLAVEEHFYLLLAVFIALLVRIRKHRPFEPIIYTFALLAGASLSLRLATWLEHPRYNHGIHLFATHLRMDGLFFGVLISYLYHQHRERFLALARRNALPALLAGLALLAPAFLYSLERTRFISTYGLTLFYLGSGLILFAALSLPQGALRLARPIAFIGSHSYSIYLWHFPLREWFASYACREWGPSFGNWTIFYLTFFGGSLLWGILMSLLVEFPMLRVRDRLFPSRASGPIPGATAPLT